VKLSQRKLSGKSSLNAAQLVNEIRILRQVRHPNLVFFYGCVVDAEGCRFGVVLEKIDGPTLCQLVWHPISGEHQRQDAIITGLASALKFLHSREPCIARGGLMSNNVLVAKRDLCPKLLDFGLSRLMTHRSTTLGGPIRWMAPEVLLRNARPKPSADVFSFGRFVFLVVTRTIPLKGMGQQAIIACLREGRVPPLDWPQGFAQLDNWKTIVDECLKMPESFRPSAELL